MHRSLGIAEWGCVWLTLGHGTWHSVLALSIQANGKPQVCRLAPVHVCFPSLPDTLPHQVLTRATISELTLQALGQSCPEGLLHPPASGPNLPPVLMSPDLQTLSSPHCPPLDTFIMALIWWEGHLQSPPS